MKTKVATAPAWQVRESARQKLLEGIQEKIIRQEDKVERTSLFRLLLYIIDKEFAFGQVWISIEEFENVPLSHKELALELFREIMKSVQQFQRSKEEGRALLAKLLEWTAGEIARKYHSALQRQEISQPRLIYGTEHATDEVPFG